MVPPRCVAQASISVPYFTIITRKCYGLGAQCMAGGATMGGAAFCVGWPTGEFGGMGLEGAVKLGYPKELASAREEGGIEAEQKLFDELLANMYRSGKALNQVLGGELDDGMPPPPSLRPSCHLPSLRASLRPSTLSAFPPTLPTARPDLPSLSCGGCRLLAPRGLSFVLPPFGLQ